VRRAAPSQSSHPRIQRSTRQVPCGAGVVQATRGCQHLEQYADCTRIPKLAPTSMAAIALCTFVPNMFPVMHKARWRAGNVFTGRDGQQRTRIKQRRCRNKRTSPERYGPSKGCWRSHAHVSICYRAGYCAPLGTSAVHHRTSITTMYCRWSSLHGPKQLYIRQLCKHEHPQQLRVCRPTVCTSRPCPRAVPPGYYCY
jgi:hypothetical protein